MLRTIKTILLLAVLLTALPLPAQNRKERRHKVSKTEMARKQATLIADELAFADETRERFIATFVNCQREMWGQLPGRPADKRGKAMTDAQTDSLIRARFDHSQRMLDTRRKYYDKYREFLTPRQISRVYELERDMMKHLNGRKHAARKAAKGKAAKAPRD